jgi:regulator of cell morphogenesis and NO signaling
MQSDIRLADLVTRVPAAVAVLEAHGLDYCCGGARSLQQACEAAGLEPEALLAEIERSRPAPAERDEVRWDQRSPAELVDHIQKRYHRALRVDLPRWIGLARQVEQVHGAKPDCPRGLRAHLEQMWNGIQAHLDKEEQILFPFVRSGSGHLARVPVRGLMDDHVGLRDELATTRDLTFGLTVPAEACVTWRSLYDGLVRLEADIKRHVHLENNVLFPMILAG